MIDLLAIGLHDCIADAHEQLALDNAFQVDAIGHEPVSWRDLAGKLDFTGTQRATTSRSSEPAEMEADQLPHGVEPQTARHHRVAREVTVEEPEVRPDVEFANDLALVELASAIGNPGDTVHHQHVGNRQLGIARAEHLAVAALEQKFWNTFCDLIDLDPALQDDSVDRDATIRGVADRILQQDEQFWAERFCGKDCCCSVVRSMEEALSDPHFRARGLFDHKLTNETGEEMPAVSVPVAPQFRGNPDVPSAAPALGEHNEKYI